MEIPEGKFLSKDEEQRVIQRKRDPDWKPSKA
jgi:hypothetical protein